MGLEATLDHLIARRATVILMFTARFENPDEGCPSPPPLS
jgi:hypothetical protein